MDLPWSVRRSLRCLPGPAGGAAGAARGLGLWALRRCFARLALEDGIFVTRKLAVVVGVELTEAGMELLGVLAFVARDKAVAVAIELGETPLAARILRVAGRRQR